MNGIILYAIFQENLCSEAAGQVYELVPNGTIMVKWADGSVSPCFPQELYLVGEEVMVVVPCLSSFAALEFC